MLYDCFNKYIGIYKIQEQKKLKYIKTIQEIRREECLYDCFSLTINK